MNILAEFKREGEKTFSTIVNNYSKKNNLNPISMNFNNDEETLYVLFEPIIKYEGN